MLEALSPLDGRYQIQTKPLRDYFSEYALIKYRVYVEVEYLKALIRLPLPQLSDLPYESLDILTAIHAGFDTEAATEIKNIEKVTNHDVKAVEYYIKSKLNGTILEEYKEFVHFGLTSQDINNTAMPLMMKDAMQNTIIPALEAILTAMHTRAQEYKGVPMLAKTHGQAASPTTLGKEWMVFIERLQDEIATLHQISFKCKFGGATGNLNAHKVTYPQVDWIRFADQLTSDMGLVRSQHTTQIAHYDDIAAISHSWTRVNTILIDFCRDMWSYISMDYFKQKTSAGEVGSSAMPHKVNPIDFENAEGNLGMANAVFGHLAAKLPISRLQRDLTDSTVLRNLGVPFGHSLIAYQSVIKGIGKLLLNREAIEADLEQNWAVIAEAIQNILRREMYHEPYEALKALTRGKSGISKTDIHQFIMQLDVSEDVKTEMLAITPYNYIGYY
ncbi:MAG: adenylosuccinate lyase [Saprospiraceae bacterium]|nr:adenylosuccinate lyase [Saprospiraceae bacterium]